MNDRGQLAGKHVAIYARFSSQMQREASIEDQVRRCKEFVEQRGGSVNPRLVFADKATSGASLHRRGFEELMNAVEKKTVEVIVTEDMSRISRDFADAASVFKRLQYAGVPLIGVGDGIDTSAQHAKMAFTLKSLMSDLYLDDLRDKTLRGLEGRALAGYSTGGLPIGYRSIAELDAHDRVVGHRIVVDETSAAVVRRIFALYLDGYSIDAIAKLFNSEDVPPPRAKTRHRRKGWVAGTIRAILHNAAYVGEWTFKKREWRKLPGTNTRRYRARPEGDVIRRTYEDRRIIDCATWQAVHERLASVRRCYTNAANGDAKGRASGRQNEYVLSSILHCGLCGATMTISGGGSARYYRCNDNKKRGTCTNSRLLREDVARACLLDALEKRYGSPAAVAYLRKKLAELLGKRSREVDADLAERRARLARTEERIAGLVRFISEGDHSAYVRQTLADLEAQAKTDKRAIVDARKSASKPIELPSPDRVLAQCASLHALVGSEPLRAREALRKLFDGERLLVIPQPDGTYQARGRIFPLAFFALDLTARGPQNTEAPLSRGLGAALSSSSCAGRI